MKELTKWLRGRIAALRGARSLAYLFDMSRSLRSVRLALPPARRFLQRFPRQNDDEIQRLRNVCNGTYTDAQYSQSEPGGGGGDGSVINYTVEKYTLILSSHRLIAIVQDGADILSKINNIGNIEIVEGCRFTNEVTSGDAIVYAGELRDKRGNVWMFAIK